MSDILITGTLEPSEEQQVVDPGTKPESNGNVIGITISKPDSNPFGVLPSTNEYSSYYLGGLGVTICLTVLVLHRLKKLSDQLKSTDRR